MNVTLYEGESYISIRDFAKERDKSTHYVYRAIHHGNGARKLTHKVIDGKMMIPFSELREYAFNKEERAELRAQAEIAALNTTIRLQNMQIEQLKKQLAEANACLGDAHGDFHDE